MRPRGRAWRPVHYLRAVYRQQNRAFYALLLRCSKANVDKTIGELEIDKVDGTETTTVRGETHDAMGVIDY